MILFVDTSDREKAILALVSKTRVFKREFKTEHKLSEKLPLELKKLLTKAKMNLSRLMGIAAVTGPGGFASLRTGVTYANSLAFALDLPVAGFETGGTGDLPGLVRKKYKKRVLTPKYGKPANITVPKPLFGKGR